MLFAAGGLSACGFSDRELNAGAAGLTAAGNAGGTDSVGPQGNGGSSAGNSDMLGTPSMLAAGQGGMGNAAGGAGNAGTAGSAGTASTGGVLCGNGAVDGTEQCDQADGRCTTGCQSCPSGFANGDRCELVVRLATERSSTCAITDWGSLWCWGNNESGKLDGSSTPRLLSPQRIGDAADVVDVAVGQDHLCIVRNSGNALCRGSRANGALGDAGAITGASTAFVQVIGDYGGRSAVLEGLLAIEAGLHYTCAVSGGVDGPVFCWGDGSSGQMGKVVTTNGPHPSAVRVEHQTNGVPEPVGGYTSIVGGDDYMIAARDPGTEASWGAVAAVNEGRLPAGAAGYFALESYLGAVFGAGPFNACRANGTFFSDSWIECSGPLGAGLLQQQAEHVLFPEVVDVEGVSVGNGFGCLVRGAERSVWCWGINAEGRLGIGSSDPRYQTLQAVPGLSGIQQLDSGEFHTCSVSAGGGVSCWGRGSEGQLGNGDGSDSSVPVTVFAR